MKYIHGQLLVTFARLLFRHAEVVSGAYEANGKDRRRDVRPENVKNYPADQIDSDEIGYFWRKLSKEELLNDSLQIMQRHIDFIQQCIEHLPSE